ncbi:MAG: fluoride efflux transporter CrcB [Proteobacteria bacterium]|nr:fluoride efflux transporter CrcB [Pseudomonadota bacterium]
MNKLLPYLLVGLGGFLGANARFIAGKLISNSLPMQFPVPTFIVNVSGSFLLGLIAYLLNYIKFVNPDYLRYFLAVGFLGAYTTFSTFELETSLLIEKGAFGIALIYIFLSVVVGFICFRIGIYTGGILKHLI